MSRDIVHTCPETSFHVHGPPIGLVVPARIEREFAQELSVLAHDPHVQTGHQHHAPSAGMPTPNLDVVQLAVVAQGDGPDAIDPVPADPVVRGAVVLRRVAGRVGGRCRAHPYSFGHDAGTVPRATVEPQEPADASRQPVDPLAPGATLPIPLRVLVLTAGLYGWAWASVNRGHVGW